ncbi:MAG: TatD family hydrolase [Amoebophilaceae bacterium]|nr:TatD family hydrolase [Amoebophilaceae bacterium]
MQLIDTHAHIYTADYQKYLPTVLSRAANNYVTKIYMPNIDETTVEPMLAVASCYPTTCFPMIGIHPCHITQQVTSQLYVVEKWLSSHPFIAIGEIGIDLYHDATLLEAQKEAFTLQLKWAKQYQLPVSIHCRNAFKEVIDILTNEQDGSLKGVIHCFTGNLVEAERCISLGFYLGIGGIITLPKSNLIPVIEAVDLSHLVLETDSPYLAPVPHRGKRNEPAHLLYIAEKVAAIKSMTLEEVATITTRNAKKVS